MAGAESTLATGPQVLDIPDGVSVAFDTTAFSEAIDAHGVVFEHWRAMKSPLGLIDRFDSRRPDAALGVVGGEAESGGLIYTKAGCVSALFTGNSKDLRQFDGGQLSSGTAQITPSNRYKSGEPVFLAPMDRLFIEDCSVLVTHQQLVEAHAAGRDRLAFPAVKVQDLVDAAGVRYSEGADFEVRDGLVCWLTQRRPGQNPEQMAGRVYAVRYLFRPYWIVDALMHEVRVAQILDADGQRRTARMPQSARVVREFVFQNQERDPQATDAATSQRQAPGPADGGLGRR